MKLNSSLIYREDDAVIFDTRVGKMIELNESANQIVQCISEEKSVEEIIQELKLMYPDSELEEITEEVNGFVKNALEAGVIHEQ